MRGRVLVVPRLEACRKKTVPKKNRVKTSIKTKKKPCRNPFYVVFPVFFLIAFLDVSLHGPWGVQKHQKSTGVLVEKITQNLKKSARPPPELPRQIISAAPGGT
jgi:hypothetical protein